MYTQCTLHVHSMYAPCILHIYSIYTPHKCTIHISSLLVHYTWSLHGVNGVYVEYTWSLLGLHGLYVESTWSLHKQVWECKVLDKDTRNNQSRTEDDVSI